MGLRFNIADILAGLVVEGSSEFSLHQAPAAALKLQSYPVAARERLGFLRDLILTTTKNIGVTAVEEILKWGELGYTTAEGPTIRIDWKQKTRHQSYMYVNCNTRLITTFQVMFGDLFNYEGNRAIVLDIRHEARKKSWAFAWHLP